MSDTPPPDTPPPIEKIVHIELLRTKARRRSAVALDVSAQKLRAQLDALGSSEVEPAPEPPRRPSTP